jgi:transposase
VTLGECFEDRQTPPAPEETIKSYQRKKRRKKPLDGTPDDSGLRFNEEEVPVEKIEIENPEVEGLSPDEYDVIGEKNTYRLAQRPGSYVVLKYTRKTVKLKKTQELVTPPAPPAVFEKSYADVSFLAGLLIDKFLYHLPLYRQHLRLQASSIELSRTTLTNFVSRTADLLEPIYYALLSSILQSEVLAMDETPVKAGRKSKGKMKTAYFWPIYGDKDEIAFPFSPSRSTEVVREALSGWCGVLITDGYKVYDRFAETVDGITHAQCWVHTRRYFEKALNVEPALSAQALELIGGIYKHEDLIKKKKLTGAIKAQYRGEHIKPIVDEFFSWLSVTFQKQVLLPSSPFTKAANYALDREVGLRVFLEFPDVPPDTNHIERALRPIPMGRKNWLFCWTEVGARYVGIIQSVLQSCKLQGVDPYTYLVDVLQRIETHPAKDVHLLTPRLWKENFSDNPLRSDLFRQ